MKTPAKMAKSALGAIDGAKRPFEGIASLCSAKDGAIFKAINPATP